MERKRKLPARAARVEGVSKKRTSTPPESRSQPSPSVAITPVVEEALPRSINAGKPLPTLDAPQPEDLSTREYQSVSESGVLVESLRRSRARWLSEGIFEKYWTKPTAKTKGTPELANNPPKDSMTKLGTCTITVEPHIFEASMFAIKDPASRAAMPPMHQQQPMYRPIIQYGPPNGAMPSRPPPTQILQPHQMHQGHSKAQDITMANTGSPQAAPTITGTPDHPPRTTVTTPNPSFHNNTSTPTQTNTPPAEPPAKRTDPVIQMLAEQAATDPDLKALMKTVANGEASPAELKLFQSHIDQLTQLHKTRQAAKDGAERKAERAAQQHNGNGKTPYTAPVSTDKARQAPKMSPSERKAQRESQQNFRGSEPTVILGTENIQPSPSHASNHAPLAPNPHGHTLASGPSHYQQQPQPQALRSKGPVPSTKPDISGVVFEFTGGSGDRFLFPKFSILEYLPQGQVIASFLIVRKGSSSDSPTYDPELDYYQPITIRLYAHQGRQLDALQKIVAPPDEVRRYMDDIMDNMTRAEYVLLAMRLPLDVEPAPAVKEVEANQPIRMDDQVLWTTTNPTPVNVQAQPIPRLLTEEEKYQSFISSVAEKPL